MPEPQIGVIIATYNRLALLREAVSSVMRQSFQGWELVVVDDASDDGTWPWLLQQKSERIKILQDPVPQERSAARNRGLSRTTAHAVLFLDDDDLLAPNALELLWHGLVGHPSAVIAVGARERFYSRGQRRRELHPLRPSNRAVHKEVFLWWRAGQGQALFVRDAVVRAGGYNEALTVAEDQDLLLRTTALGSAVILPDTVLYQRMHDHPQEERRVGAIVEDGVRRAFLSALPAGERGRYRRAALSRRRWLQALNRLELGDGVGAVLNLLSAANECPLWLTSPLLRPAYLRTCRAAIVSVLPGWVIRLLRKVKVRTKILLRRAPGEAGSE